ncbi:MAG: protein CrdC [Myxococcales bacterium]|nr:protein CrdC [Myxococcales bacterium]
MISLDQVSGLVLCRAGGHRLAFPAQQVAAIRPWSGGEADGADASTSVARCGHARLAFGLESGGSKVVLADSGHGVVVDALEVYQDALPLLPPPGLVLGGAGGALRGFVSVKEELFPVLRLAEFSRYLAALGEEAVR